MSALDDLIARAIKTNALPVVEIETFAAENGKTELFETFIVNAVLDKTVSRDIVSTLVSEVSILENLLLAEMGV